MAVVVNPGLDRSEYLNFQILRGYSIQANDGRTIAMLEQLKQNMSLYCLPGRLCGFSKRQTLVDRKIRNQLVEQFKCLEQQSESRIQLLQDLQEFFRRKAEIQLEYSRSLEKLAERFSSKIRSSREHQQFKLKKQVQLCLGTINIGTMTGRSRELADTLKARQIDIACVQETKWKGAKARDIGEGFKLFYIGTQPQNGVGIVTNCLMDEKDEFWESFDGHLCIINQDERLVIGGDLKGHVDQERDGYDRFHGGQGFGTQNDNGCCALDCTEAHDLAVANTFFRMRPTHLFTYASGGQETQIDYWLIRQRDLKLATDVKVILSTNIGPQNRLLTMDLRIDLGHQRPIRKTAAEKIKW
ncbi:hypothetical protein QTP70_008340 [Hemibagrus guttatus]|uniref:FCH domain-containing protein n=1 Tax=Hemibagrus guttatus TaxID=175788 RepID=A0AAE0RHV3_9TELE|nr:hypothetical protein QTP70_008340 [Hemibagrus guttatus]